MFVPQYENGGMDYILLKLGASLDKRSNSTDKWFVDVKASSLGIHRNYPHGVVGNQGIDVSYDLDGHVDIIASQGDWFDKSNVGFYRISVTTLVLTGTIVRSVRTSLSLRELETLRRDVPP